MGADYCQRIATVSRAVRLTLLLKDKLSRQEKERRKAVAKREAAQEDFHDLRVGLAVMPKASRCWRTLEEEDRRTTEIYEQLERPEVAELIEASRAEVAVVALCRRWGYPVQVEQWLEMADSLAILEHDGFLPPKDGEDAPRIRRRPVPRLSGRRPRSPDTG